MSTEPSFSEQEIRAFSDRFTLWAAELQPREQLILVAALQETADVAGYAGAKYEAVSQQPWEKVPTGPAKQPAPATTVGGAILQVIEKVTAAAAAMK